MYFTTRPRTAMGFPANFALPAWISATVWPFAARLMPERSGAAGRAAPTVVGWSFGNSAAAPAGTERVPFTITLPLKYTTSKVRFSVLLW